MYGREQCFNAFRSKLKLSFVPSPIQGVTVNVWQTIPLWQFASEHDLGGTEQAPEGHFPAGSPNIWYILNS